MALPTACRMAWPFTGHPTMAEIAEIEAYEAAGSELGPKFKGRLRYLREHRILAPREPRRTRRPEHGDG